MKAVAIIIVLALIPVVAQISYTLVLNKYCEPHFEGKRIQFWSKDDLAFRWEYDILGLTTRTMNELVTRHSDVLGKAAASRGNMHNPPVKDLRTTFEESVLNQSWLSADPHSIEKFELVERGCGENA